MKIKVNKSPLCKQFIHLSNKGIMRFKWIQKVVQPSINLYYLAAEMCSYIL